MVAAVNIALAVALTNLFDPLYAATALALAYGASYTAAPSSRPGCSSDASAAGPAWA